MITSGKEHMNEVASEGKEIEMQGDAEQVTFDSNTMFKGHEKEHEEPQNFFARRQQEKNKQGIVDKTQNSVCLMDE